MSFIILGIIAFIFFFLYDINSVIINNRLVCNSFWVGCFFLIAATTGIVMTSLDIKLADIGTLCVWGLFAILFLLLLIYTLFWELPFKETYIKTDTLPKIYKDGFYALCRHPGVLWFMGFYLSLWMMVKGPVLLTAGIIFSLLNILYVIFQDNWSFMKTFADYDEYMQTTPFLFPTFNSIKRCFQTLYLKRGDGVEL
jgi:protein-S-isoprenylcysteine O-methyltransferase Ste14